MTKQIVLFSASKRKRGTTQTQIMSAGGCAENKDALLCIGYDSAISISWTIATVVFVLTLGVLAYRVYLDKTVYSSNAVQLNEIRPTGNEVTNAMWRALSTGYSFSILLAGLSIDASSMSFFHDRSVREALTYLLFLSKVPVVIAAGLFTVVTVVTPIFRRRLAFPITPGSRADPFSSASFSFYFYFTVVYLLIPIDLGVLKMLPWRGTDFTFTYMGYPSATVLYLSVFSSLLSIAAQFIAAMVILPSGLAGATARKTTYYLPITDNAFYDEAMYWIFILFTLMQFLGNAVYAGIIVHQTLSGRLTRLEAKVQESSTFQRLATSEDQVVDSMHGGPDHDVEIEFGTRNPVQFAATGANLNKRSSFH